VLKSKEIGVGAVIYRVIGPDGRTLYYRVASQHKPGVWYTQTFNRRRRLWECNCAAGVMSGHKVTCYHLREVLEVRLVRVLARIDARLATFGEHTNQAERVKSLGGANFDERVSTKDGDRTIERAETLKRTKPIEQDAEK
jgi:hypothetical protein